MVNAFAIRFQQYFHMILTFYKQLLRIFKECHAWISEVDGRWNSTIL